MTATAICRRARPFTRAHTATCLPACAVPRDHYHTLATAAADVDVLCCAPRQVVQEERDKALGSLVTANRKIRDLEARTEEYNREVAYLRQGWREVAYLKQGSQDLQRQVKYYEDTMGTIAYLQHQVKDLESQVKDLEPPAPKRRCTRFNSAL